MLEQNPASDPDIQETQPLEAALIESPEEEAYRLAIEHKIRSEANHSVDLYSQLKQQSNFLDEAHREFQSSDDEAISASYAGEWILDNYYIIQRTLRQIREDLPPGYYRQLPKLANPPLAGFPRVYAIAHELIASRDASIHMEHVETFILAYQQVEALNIGEIWAIPIMLRLGFIETLIHSIAGILQKKAPVADHRPEHLQLQIETDTIIAHCITSLRTIENYEWNDFFDRVSLVEGILSTDPANVYARMDFESRDRYRKVVESLALLVDQSETDVARAAISLAETSARTNEHVNRIGHVGYWLIDQGYFDLRTGLGYSPKGSERMVTGCAVIRRQPIWAA
jgi:cyclic beta-1,2-glucan synthetase